jgi:ankyrin repeat protein
MLKNGVNLNVPDPSNETLLHLALERPITDRYQVLEILLKHGAPVNGHGVNDWTPTHMAAVYEDIEALKLLIDYGADLTISTNIDEYATPLEEARNLGKHRSVEFLKGLTKAHKKGKTPKIK